MTRSNQSLALIVLFSAVEQETKHSFRITDAAARAYFDDPAAPPTHVRQVDGHYEWDFLNGDGENDLDPFESLEDSIKSFTEATGIDPNDVEALSAWVIRCAEGDLARLDDDEEGDEGDLDLDELMGMLGMRL